MNFRQAVPIVSVPQKLTKKVSDGKTYDGPMGVVPPFLSEGETDLAVELTGKDVTELTEAPSGSGSSGEGSGCDAGTGGILASPLTLPALLLAGMSKKR